MCPHSHRGLQKDDVELCIKPESLRYLPVTGGEALEWGPLLWMRRAEGVRMLEMG